MTEEQKQPREYDAVLGGQKPPPTYGAVLGGIEGVKMRLNSNIEKARLDAVFEAMKYGDAGLDLVIETLKDESFSVRKSAIKCLWKLQENLKVKRALSKCNIFSFFECLYVCPDSNSRPIFSVAITPDGKTVVSGGCDLKIWDLDSGKLLRIPDKNSTSYYEKMEVDGQPTFRMVSPAEYNRKGAITCWGRICPLLKGEI